METPIHSPSMTATRCEARAIASVSAGQRDGTGERPGLAAIHKGHSMSDFRSIFFEMAVNVLPKQFWLVKSDCGGEALIAASNQHLAVELAARLWKSVGYDEPMPHIRAEPVPLILCPESFCPAPCYSGKGDMRVIGERDDHFFGDVATIKAAIETARETYEEFEARRRA